MNTAEGSVPIEDFVQALQAQLDRAQRAMHTKARNLNLPLTFAVKDISIDLRTHVEVVRTRCACALPVREITTPASCTSR